MFTIYDKQAGVIRGVVLRDALAESFAGSELSPSTDPATGDLLLRDPRGNDTRLSFDERGFVSGSTTPMGRAFRMENDASGRPLAFTGPSGLRLGVRYNRRGAVSGATRGDAPLFEVEHDAEDLPAVIRYPDGTTRRLEHATPERPTAIVDRLGATERFEYDEEHLTALQDANGNRTTFEYGSSSQPDRVVFADGSHESYGYDPAGLVERISAGADLVATIARDGEGRIASVAYADGETVSFTHDGAGRLVEARSREGVVAYTYDDRGRVVREAQDGGAVEYVYDEAGALGALVYPSGERVEIAYDADARVSSVKDWSGGVHAFEYGEADSYARVTAPNGLATLTTRTAVGHPSSIVTRFAATGAPAFSIEYDRDAEDRVIRRVDSVFGARSYTYDAEGRLLAAEAAEAARTEAFAYDPAGNRVSASGAEATFNALNQLTRQGDVGCAYDARGNLVSMSSQGGAWRYTYDLRNLLVRAEGPDGQDVAFGYDALSRRIWKRSAASEVRYVWAGEQVVREVTRTGGRTTVQDYLYVPGSFAPLATRIDGAVYSYHTDHLGTPRRLTDARGNVVWAADYAAYGQAWIRTEHVTSHLRLPGQLFDRETGLHYNRFRYYAPALGRYLSRDPSTFLAGLNFYAYAHGDPVNQADALGLWSWKSIVSVVAAVVVGVAVTAAIIATAPVSLPALAVTAVAIVAGGAAAGAVGFGLNEALNQGKFCLACILKEMARGALIGALAALPFAFLPATAGVLAFMGAGALSGAIGYIGDFLTNPSAKWSWKDFAISVGIGAVTAGLARFLAGKYAAWRNRAPPEDPNAQAAAQRLAQHRADVAAHRARYQQALDDARANGASRRSQGGQQAKITEAQGEADAADFMEQNYPNHQMESGFSPGTGFDQVYVTRGPDGNISGYTIVEAKGPGASLSTGAVKGDQMSTTWVTNTAREMSTSSDPQQQQLGTNILNALRTGDPPVTGKVITSNPGGGATEMPSANVPNGGRYN